MEINSIKEFADNFQKIFFEEVKPELNYFEQLRFSVNNNIKKHDAKYSSRHKCIIIGTFVCLILLARRVDFDVVFNYGLLAVFVIGFIFLFDYAKKGKMMKDFETKVKSEFMPILMKAFGNFKWSQTGVISPVEITYSGLYPVENMKTDDNFTGSYKNVNIRISEAHLEYKYKKNSDSCNSFYGVFVMLDMNKNFSGKTIVTPRLIRNNLEEVELEKSEFTKKFTIYSDDQIEARYILTPAFMERFVKLKKVFNTSLIQAAFYNNRLLIAIEQPRDCFMLFDNEQPLNDFKPYQTFFNELVAILEIVDVLKLNEKLGL